MRKSIVVRIAEPGFHCWSEPLAEVEFLGFHHRHLFEIEVEIEVGGLDREAEFFLVRREIKEFLGQSYPKGADGYEFGCRSCEMIAAELADYFSARRVSVFEDGENGAVVYA